MANLKALSIVHRNIKNYVSLFLIFFIGIGSGTAQTFTQVSHFGTATISGNSINVTSSSGFLVSYTACAPVGPYWIGSNTNSNNYYKYEFSNPVQKVRFDLWASDNGEHFIFKLNNTQYVLTAANLSSLPSTAIGSTASCTNCTDTGYTITSTGTLLQTQAAGKTGCIRIEISGTAIDSVKISEQPTQAGSVFSFFFANDTAAYIVPAFADTVHCPGDTFALPYKTSGIYNSGNVFSAELSNAVGSFASPTVIGTKTATNSDTIICVIPKNMASATGYKLRIASSSPAKVSTFNIKGIIVKNTPANVTLSANAPICVGDTLQLNSTPLLSVSREWTGPSSFTATTANPTRPNMTAAWAGDYILKTTLNSTGCSVYDTISVSTKPLPAAVSASSNTPLCEDSTIQLTVGTSTNGSTYSWEGPGGYTAGTQNASRTSATPAMSGDYISTVTLNGCSIKDTIAVLVKPTPTAPVAGYSSPLCMGDNLQLSVAAVSGVTYQWWGPAAFSSAAQNPVRTNMQPAYQGDYQVVYNLNGCLSDTGSVTVSAAPRPYVFIYASPGDTICPNGSATFIALANNAGSNPTFQWTHNTSTVGTGSTYTSGNLSQGDVIYCTMSASGLCANAVDTNSNAITMTVLPYLSPAASIMVSPSTIVAPWSMVTFTATTTDAGNSPQYQWKRNGQNVVGATGSVWGTYSLSDGDTICVEVTSSYRCPKPATALSNCIGMNLLLSTKDLNNTTEWQLYPNPNNGNFTIKGTAPNGKTNVLVYNAIGQLVYEKAIIISNHQLNTTVDMGSVAAGIYLLKLQTTNGMEVRQLRVD